MRVPRPRFRLSRRSILFAVAGAPFSAITGCGGSGDGDDDATATKLEAGDETLPASVSSAAAPSTVSTSATMAAATRHWAMGFSRMPPRFDVSTQLQCLDTMRRHAEYVLMQEPVPWAELLAGVPASTLVARDLVPLADYARALGLDIVFMPELTDGLARGLEAAGLRAIDRSLAEAPVRQAYCDFVLEVVQQLKPQTLGLAAEVNAVRLLAPEVLYGHVVDACRQCAEALQTAGHAGELMIGIQAEVAWGLMPGQRGYQGIGQDLQDFPAAEVIGLSTYPYTVFAQPEAVPLDYYSRLAPPGVPVMVIEGGWPSQGATNMPSGATTQARYLERQATLLDSVSARGLTQLMLADLDLATLPAEYAAGLASFAALGVMDRAFGAKPALAVWEELRARPLLR